MENDKRKIWVKYTLLIGGGMLLGWLLFGRSAYDHEVESEMVQQADTEFTCSMHPQVRQDEPGNCPICGMELIPVADDDDHQHDDPFLFSMPEMYSKWANIRTMQAEEIHTGPSIRLPGRVAVNERERRQISAHFPGRIETLYADYTGRFIQQGEVLATIYSPEIMQAQQELIQAAATRETQPRLYESARQRLELFNLTREQIDLIEERGQASPNTDVHATQSGYLIERAVSEGDYVSTGQTLFAIASLSDVWVELDSYETRIRLIQPGQQADVHIPAQPGTEFTGKVEFVDPVLDPRTRSARVRLTVANRDNLLMPGMLVTARITAADHEPRLVIPFTSVLWTGERSVVYVRTPHDDRLTFEFREIETGPRTDEGYIVVSGLNRGEEIAVNGVFAIDAAAQLQGRFSMMAPPERTEIPEPFRSDLKILFEIYFDLKNALADDAPQEARKHGLRLQQQLEKTGPHSLEGEHHMFWMEQYDAIDDSLDEFLEADNLAGMRVPFEPLSEAFIETARTLGAIDDTWYVAWCPMVDDDRGAYWLSEFEEILNPYFGAMMLRCGEVTEVLREGVTDIEIREPVHEHVH